MRLADYIMARLHRAGVRHVFQVTGRGSLFLNDALAKYKELTAVSLHHEQSCAFAAVGYADQTGGIGACLVSTGCASTNAVTGVLSAWQDGIPCVFVSGQNILGETQRHTGLNIRTYGQQEADIISIVEPITKYAKMVENPADIMDIMDDAIHYATEGRKGPVWIDVPLDLQSAIVDYDPENQLEFAEDSATLSSQIQSDVDYVANQLQGSLRPVVLIGSGVRSGKAEQLLLEFIESTRIPLLYTASAPDIIGSHHELSIGSVGSMGCSRAGNFTIQNADFVLVLGSRLSSLTTGPDIHKFARHARIVVVDIDADEHKKSTLLVDKFVQCDVQQFVTLLNAVGVKPVSSNWVSQCTHWKALFEGAEPLFCSPDRIDLYELADEMSRLFPANTSLVTDSGLIEVILPTNIKFRKGMRCIHPVSQGAMGFALPASIGVSFAGSKFVVAVIGDGSIMMNLQELESVRYLGLPIKIIVINNNMYSIIRRRQHDLFRNRTIGTDCSNGVSAPDFQQVASCFGLKYMRIASRGELTSGLNQLLATDGPVLCELMGREDQGYIEISTTRSMLDNKFVRRPLEDQKPFLDRNLFLKEMLVQPIDQ